MIYFFTYQKPHNRLINVEFHCRTNSTKTRLCLPVWRPGRYERGNFAANIVSLKVYDPAGQNLPFKKVSSHEWEVLSSKESEIVVKYTVYTPEFNAGSCWIDSRQIFINGIQCCIYNPELIDEPYDVQLNVPESFTTACGLTLTGPHGFKAKDFHELVDCPLVSSPHLKKKSIVVNGITFHLWFQGIQEMPDSGVLNDFEKLIRHQLSFWNEFVATEYHFIFQFTPYRFYHGVEHLNSTVIVLGPEHEIFNGTLYKELLGLSSHELFHCWNVKTIRPADFFPYKYQEENYSRLGYIYEGITTYYGDLLLLRCGLYDWNTYVQNFNIHLLKHFHNSGKNNLSLAESSFDTWLDGYTPGVPGRKVSIYTEGALCAWILDRLIRENSHHELSLDDVMRLLFRRFGKNKKGFTENDFRSIIEELTHNSFCYFFDDLIHGTRSYYPYLQETAAYYGLKISEYPNPNPIEKNTGIKLLKSADGWIVRYVEPGSPADKAGVIVESKIISINGTDAAAVLDKTEDSVGSGEITMILEFWGKLHEIKVPLSESHNYYPIYSLEKLAAPSALAKTNFEKWSNTRY